MQPLRPADADDAWYASEPSTRLGMIAEIQRIRRRARVRPWRVIVLAALVTGAITYKLATRPVLVEGQVVLALSEGSLSAKHNGLPVDELKQFVTSVLLPDTKLADLIERRDLYRSRHRLGMPYAVDELRSQIEIEIWKNSFVYYDADAQNAEHSARIGITVADTDPDRAFQLARDIAGIVIETSRERRQQFSSDLSTQIGAMREGLTDRLGELEHERDAKLVALTTAQKEHAETRAQALGLQIAEIDAEQKHAEQKLSAIAQSRDGLADRIAAAGLDMSVTIVEEHRPDRPEHKGFVLAMVAVVVGVGSLLGAALLLGAFDSRVHDTDDVSRLGLPVLGHVPGFPGDQFGSLASRGAIRARVPSSLRWRSHR